MSYTIGKYSQKIIAKRNETKIHSYLLPENKNRDRNFLYLQTSTQLSKLNCATTSPVINNIAICKSRHNIHVKRIEERIQVNNQSNRTVETSTIQYTVSNNYSLIDVGKDNP